MSLASPKEIQSALNDLEHWVYQDETLSREFKFDSYMAGIDFVNLLAKKAEEVNHHPDLEIGWCRVKVSYTSHDQGGVTPQCIEMAKRVDQLILDQK